MVAQKNKTPHSLPTPSNGTQDLQAVIKIKHSRDSVVHEKKSLAATTS